MADNEFDIPLDSIEREEIHHYMSQPGIIYCDEKRRKLKTPSKFDFLSGIHPDLDKALSDIEFQQSQSSQMSKSEIKWISDSSDLLVEPENASNRLFLIDDEFDGVDDIYHQSRHQSFRSTSAKQNIEESIVKSQKIKTESKKKSNRRRRSDVRSDKYSSALSVTDTASSKPKEISCPARMDYSSIMEDSLPFSMDGMEKAKNKIKHQAEKIRDLEAKLKKVTIPKKDCSDGKKKLARKSLTPEERLQAHMQRKHQENKYKEGTGKWADPPPLKQSSLLSNVKRKDDLTMRLTADPKERKQQDLVKKSVKRTLKKYARATSDDESSGKITSKSEVTKSKVKSKGGSGKKSTASYQTAEKKREILMNRLNMGVSERRMTKNSDDVSDVLRRALDGHKVQKRTWAMSDEYDEMSKRRVERNGAVNSKQLSDMDANRSTEEENSNCTTVVNRCQSCNSLYKCEEDVDNPGVFYCLRCWEEYEVVEKGPKYYASDVENSIGNHSLNSMENYKMERGAASTYDDALWIVHDNPKLGSQLVSSGSRKMRCLVETQEKKKCVRIMLGYIDYCGSVIESGIGDLVVEETNRGSECIRLRDLQGFVINHDEVETRLSKDKLFYEFHADPNKAVALTGKHAYTSVKDFMSGCSGAVDVIIDPQCAPGSWYPHREADSNSRKLAPQFRSKGIGYIRLGDDMGKNGLAFLSSDSCRTFYSANSMEANRKTNISKFRSSLANARSTHTDKKVQSSRVQHQSCCMKIPILSENYEYDSSNIAKDDDEDGTSSTSSANSAFSAGDNSGAGDDASELLKHLQNFEASKDLKWNDKADILLRLGKAIEKPSGRMVYDGALTYIQDVIGAKNINVHVLRSALQSVERIGLAMSKEVYSHVTWKTILIEMLNLLRSKQVKANARDTLKSLHGQCFTLGNSLSIISHVLGMGKSGQAGKRRSLGIGGVQNAQLMIEKQKANNVDIIEWLAEMTEVERSMEEIDPIIDRDGLSSLALFFLKHENHRDARCRKNALDGLLHTILYGVNKLGMDISNAQSLCPDLEKGNPRAWSRLLKSVKAIYKHENKR